MTTEPTPEKSPQKPDTSDAQAADKDTATGVAAPAESSQPKKSAAAKQTSKTGRGKSEASRSAKATVTQSSKYRFLVTSDSKNPPVPKGQLFTRLPKAVKTNDLEVLRDQEKLHLRPIGASEREVLEDYAREQSSTMKVNAWIKEDVFRRMRLFCLMHDIQQGQFLGYIIDKDLKKRGW